MAEERVQRRLAAILAADVVGYSRMMSRDEGGTLTRLKSIRREIFEPKTKENGGRIFKTTGDGAFVEFKSAVDAVKCASDIQAALAARNEQAPEDERTLLRIGISLGDVIVEGSDLYGNGVNVASRMEGLAEPGGICVSGNVHEHVGMSLDVKFEDLGEQSVKNFDRPVRCYRVLLEHTDAEKAPSPPLPDKPSVAVLPFDNLSGDPEQDYFADGISEDIITALSHIHQFFVVARNTTFTFKGEAVDVQAVARNLGVRYVLEGSVRRAGNRVRISAQLIDATTGNHLWAERYDREIEDIFTVQDEITQTVVGAILPELSQAEQERARRKPPENLDAWECYQRGIWHTYRRTRDDLKEAKELFNRAAAFDPHMAAAYAGLVDTYFFQIVDGHAKDKDHAIQEAISAGRKAVDLDGRDALAHYALGRAYTIAGIDQEAIAQLKEAVRLNPNLARAEYALGFALVQSGQPEDGLPHLHTSIRLSPHEPTTGQFMVQISMAHLFLHQYEEALEWARESLRQPHIRWSRWMMLIASLGHLDRIEEAAEAIKEMHRSMPEIDLGFFEKAITVSHAPSREHLLDGLRKAGMTE